MGSFSIGDILSVLKLLGLALRHRQFRVIYWSIRRRFSAKRLRQQTRLVHQDLAHKARDIVAERLEFWAEAERNVEAIAKSIDAGSARSDPARADLEEVNPVRLETELKHLDEFISDTQTSVDEFLTNSCQALSKYLTEWMPADCFVSIHVVMESQAVIGSAQFAKHAQSERFKDDAARISRQIETHREESTKRIPVACVRARCGSSKDRGSSCFPWRVVQDTTALDSLLSSQWHDKDGHDHLYQEHDTHAKKKRGGAPYKDPSQESQLCRTVVTVPVRGFALARHATMGFVWLDSPMPYAFLSMFQHDPDPQKRTAGLHLLHAFSDTVATVLACERNVIRGASHAKDRLMAGSKKLNTTPPTP